MKRGEWHEAARRMSGEGTGYGEIARVLGVTHSAVWKVLNVERTKAIRRRDNALRGEAKRAWENEHDRHPCPQCGAPMGAGSHRHAAKCKTCEFADRAELHEVKLSLVEGMWADGWPMQDIAEVFGYRLHRHVSPMVNELRQQGRAPYRYRVRQREAA